MASAEQQSSEEPSRSGRCHPDADRLSKTKFPVPKRHICKVVPSPSPILRELPTSKSSPCMAIQHQALVWATHRIVVQPLDSSIAAPQTYVVKSRYGESTPAIIEGSMLSIDELRTEFVNLRGRNSVSRECVRVVDVVLQLAVLWCSIGANKAVDWRSRCGGLAGEFAAGS